MASDSSDTAVLTLPTIEQFAFNNLLQLIIIDITPPTIDRNICSLQ